MTLSKELRSFAAKSSDLSNELYLPVYVHCADTADVMEYLLFKRMSAHERQRICGICETELVKLVRFLGMVHDIGKLTPFFQAMISKNIRGLAEIIKKFEIVLTNAEKCVHAKDGEVILRENGINKKICEIVGSHHGKPQTADIASKYSIRHNGDFWKSIWCEFIDYSLEYAGYADVSEIPQRLDMPAQMLLTGLLITADWIASNQSLFPPFNIDDCGIDNIDRSARLSYAVNKLALPDYWKSDCVHMDAQAFENRFGFLPNTVQDAVIDIANNAEKPIMMIIEAQMGIGKTEAALSAAEIMNARFELGGVFFGLPTQATTNCIFKRSLEWLSSTNKGQTLSVRLAHSNAELENAYRSLPSADSIETDSDEKERLITHSWFDGRKKSLLADCVVGTVDQILMASLKQKHVMLRHLGLAGKVVIIDECHAYDAYMNVYLDRTLRWLGEYKTPVIILSATLPVERRNELIRAYIGRENYKKLSEDPALPDEAAYPLISWSDGTFIRHRTFGHDFVGKTVCVRKTCEDEICDILSERLYDGGCAGIIVNSVDKAQQLAKRIKEELPTFETELFHSRFIMTDRAKREELLIKNIGKSSSGDRRNRIIIGTQVLEQSLDLDFDLLITELCPIDLLLQRIGRLHRHERVRPKSLREPMCFVTGTDDNEFDYATEKIYGKWLLGQTLRVLPPEITLPDDIAGLVREVYKNYDTAEISEEDECDYDEYQRSRKEKKRKANNFCITEPIPEPEDEDDDIPTLHDMLNKDYSVNDEQKSEAKVRDGGDSVEVIVLRQTEKGYVETVSGELKLPSYSTPDDEDARRLAKERLRLPYSLCTEHEIGKTIDVLEAMSCSVGEFQSAKILRGELFLILNEESSAEINGYRLIYDKELGLITEKQCKEE